MGEESKMESRGGTLTIFEQVLVNGKLTPATLSGDGKLWWTEKIERCLDLEKEVLSFSTDGSKITIRASVVNWSELLWPRTSWTRGCRRKDIVLEPLSEELPQLWCQKLQEFLDSLDLNGILFFDWKLKGFQQI